MTLEQISNRMTDLSEKYRVPEHLEQASRTVGEVSEKVYDRMTAAGEAAKRGATMAYRAALEHPRTSAGGLIIAAALVGGALWFVFGNWRTPRVQRRRAGTTRVRAGTERRRKHRAAARPAAR
jgi:hypothetical protein